MAILSTVRGSRSDIYSMFQVFLPGEYFILSIITTVTILIRYIFVFLYILQIVCHDHNISNSNIFSVVNFTESHVFYFLKILFKQDITLLCTLIAVLYAFSA